MQINICLGVQAGGWGLTKGHKEIFEIDGHYLGYVRSPQLDASNYTLNIYAVHCYVPYISSLKIILTRQ